MSINKPRVESKAFDAMREEARILVCEYDDLFTACMLSKVKSWDNWINLLGQDWVDGWIEGRKKRSR